MKRVAPSLWLAGICLAGWLLGQVARDFNWITGMMFYVPGPVVTAIVLLCARDLARRERGRTAAVLALLALPPILVTAAENHWRRASTHDGQVELVHWNVFYGRLGWERAAQVLRARGADLYVLSEIPDDIDGKTLAAAVGDGYQAEILAGMAVMARGRLDGVERLVRWRHLDVFQVRWRWEDADLRLFVLDSTGDLRVPRDPLMREIVSWIGARQPDLVIGDFNAPRRSRALWPPPEGYVHAYDASGAGWGYTWPAPLPLLAIDQCLAGKRILPRRYELRTFLWSDHRMQTLRFDVRE